MVQTHSSPGKHWANTQLVTRMHSYECATLVEAVCKAATMICVNIMDYFQDAAFTQFAVSTWMGNVPRVAPILTCNAPTLHFPHPPLTLLCHITTLLNACMHQVILTVIVAMLSHHILEFIY